MKVEQIYTGCLAHAAYYLESNGEAAIFDPLREVDPYIKPRHPLDEHGRGIYLMSTIMDKMEYCETEQGHVLEMTKTL